MSAATLLERVVAGMVERGEAQIEWAPGYAEPGYPSDSTVWFANWNPKTFGTREGEKREDSTESRIARLVDATGLDVECEWSDEWTTCCDCGKAVRTEPNSYSWVPSYVFVEDQGDVCHECLTIDEQQERLWNNPDAADTIGFDWTTRGWSRCQGWFESGLHPGQNDDPRQIAKRIEDVGKCDFLFEITGQGQFDTRFVLWVRPRSKRGDY